MSSPHFQFCLFFFPIKLHSSVSKKRAKSSREAFWEPGCQQERTGRLLCPHLMPREHHCVCELSAGLTDHTRHQAGGTGGLWAPSGWAQWVKAQLLTSQNLQQNVALGAGNVKMVAESRATAKARCHHWVCWPVENAKAGNFYFFTSSFEAYHCDLSFHI